MGEIFIKKVVFIAAIAVLALLFSLDSYSAVLINEILANGLNDPDYEWVELFNNASSDANLTSWNMSESSSSNFTLSTTIPANSFIILAADFRTFNSTYPNVNLSGIKIINITISNFNLADSSGEVRLYNSSGTLVDSIAYVQASGKAFENVSIGKYPDGSPSTFNLSTLTPGAKNDNHAPMLKWINPSRNNTNVSGLVTITVNITDDTTQVNSASIIFNGTNFSMGKNGDLWTFAWNTSLNAQKQYNITVFFNDSYGKSGSDRLLNIFVNNSPNIISFSPPSLAQALAEGSSLTFNVNASDPDDTSLSFMWLIDNVQNSTSSANFTYNPGFNDNGTHSINATVKDPSSNQASLKWTITVANLNRAPSLDVITNKSVSKNANLSFNISASDADDDALSFSGNVSSVSVSKISNSLATISWKPTNLDLGSNVINFTASDGSLTSSRLVTISVDGAGNNAPAIASSPKTSAVADEAYSYDVDANDQDNDTLSFSLRTDASGMSIDSSSGVINFVPSSAGFFNANVSVTDYIGIANQSFNITVGRGAILKIINVDAKIDGKAGSSIADGSKISRKAKPESNVEFKARVKNGFTAAEGLKIRNINLKITIEGIDSDEDLEEEAGEFDLSPQGEKTAALKFNVPLNADEGSYNVLIEAQGDDENGTRHERQFKTELEVEKKKHDLRFIDFELKPEAITCSQMPEISYKVMNLGQEDEEKSVIEIRSPELGLEHIDSGVSIKSGTEDNTISGNLRFKIDDSIENGGYKISADVFADNGKLTNSKTAELIVKDCINAKEVKENVFLQEASQPAELKPTEQIEKTEELLDWPNIRLLVFSSIAATGFFVFTAIMLFVKL